MGLWSRFKRTFRRGNRNAEIEEELRFHLAMDMADGHDSREARIRLGNMTRVAEDAGSMGIVQWLDSALQDARYGLRQLRKTPALAFVVVLSVAIGVGANTAIFSLVDAALLKPLPVKDPDSLRIIEWTSDEFPAGASNINGDFEALSGNRVQASSVGANQYRRLAREQNGFAALIGAGDPDSVAINVDSSAAEQVDLQYVSSNFFQALGVSPVLGRAFRDDEDRVGQEPVVIVSHRFWISRLAGAPDALDRKIRINNAPARIVGVAPAGFFGLRAGEWIDVYTPLAMRVALEPVHYGVAPRGEDDTDWWVRQIGRLKPGISEAAARTQIAALFRNLVSTTPAFDDANKDANRKNASIPELITLPGRRGFNALGTRESSALWILMLLVGVLLLIVCANVANLLLSRSVSRQRESAVRLALGASRIRLFRQHLIESAMLALLGGAAGLAVGYILARALHLMFERGSDARNAFDLHLDWRLLLYTAALSSLTALLFGLAPALRASRADLGDALKSQAKAVIAGRLRLPRVLVSVQIALCVVALLAAGLLSRSLQNLKSVAIGFDPQNLSYASVNPWQARYSAERVAAYADRIRDELGRLPGVVRVSTVQVRTLSGNGNMSELWVQGRPHPDTKGFMKGGDTADRNHVGSGYFETMRIPMKGGRTFEQRDMRPKADVAIVDDLFTRRYFPNTNPLGKRFGFNQKEENRFEIIGVVPDTLYNSLRGDPTPTVYQPYLPGEFQGNAIHFAIRSRLDSGRLAEAVRKTVAAVDPSVPLTEFKTQTGLIDRLLRTERLLAFTSTTFSLIALTLAAIGIGGLLAYAVARRTNEIGVRMALGAAAGDLVRMILRDALMMVAGGVAIGLPCAYAIGRVLKALLFQLGAFDVGSAALALVALLTAALIAAWLPARRAAKVDPMTALREE